jgi:hypothetical protein
VGVLDATRPARNVREFAENARDGRLQPDHLAICLGGIVKLAQSFAALSEQKPRLVTIGPHTGQQFRHASRRCVLALASEKLTIPIQCILVARVDLQNPAISARGLIQFAGLMQLRRFLQYVCDRPQVEPPRQIAIETLLAPVDLFAL